MSGEHLNGNERVCSCRDRNQTVLSKSARVKRAAQSSLQMCGGGDGLWCVRIRLCLLAMCRHCIIQNHAIRFSPDWIIGDICWLVDKDGWDLNRSRSSVETGVIKWDWFQPSCKEKLIKEPQLNYIYYVAEEQRTFTAVYIKAPTALQKWRCLTFT